MGGAHVAAGVGDVLGVTTVGGEIGGETLHHVVVSALGGVHNGGALEVDEQADVVLPAPGGGLVDPDLADGLIGSGGPGELHVVVQNPPQPGVVLADQIGHRAHRHLGLKRHQQGLEEQGEPRLRTGPRHGDLAHAVSGAADARNPGLQVGLVLEEVEVPPRLRLGVVDTAGRLVPLGAGEAGSAREVEVKVEAVAGGVEVHRLDHPRVLQTQRGLEQLQVVHDGPPHLSVAGKDRHCD